MVKRITAALVGVGLVIGPVGGGVSPLLAELIPTRCVSPGRQWTVDFDLFRSDGRTPLGSQHIGGVTREGKQWLKSVTSFADGSRWEEEALVELGEVVRPLIYKRRYRNPDGRWESVEIDYKKGIRKERREGQEEREQIELPPDTYVGPMVGLVVRCAAAGGTIEFHSLSFQNHPGLHSMTARLVGEGSVPWGPEQGSAAAKVRLKADLGTIGNFLLGGIIPDNSFWLSTDGSRTVLGWDGPSDWAAANVVAVRANKAEPSGEKVSEK